MTEYNHKHDFIPSREADLLNWSRAFDARINIDPPQLGLTIAQASAYTSLHDAYALAYQRSKASATRTPTQIVAKDQAKKSLKAYARMLARVIRACPDVTNDQRMELGLTVPDTALTAVAKPSYPPVVIILPSLGRTVRIRLSDSSESTRRGKPRGIAGAAVFSYVALDGENSPPARQADWTFHGNATRRFFNVNFDAEVPAGSKVWIAASWYNTRGQLGPASTPQCTRIGEGVAKFATAA